MTALDAERKRALFEATALPLTTALYNAALRLTGASADASDLVQETFLRAYRTFENFSLGTNCKAWLLTILYSVHITSGSEHGTPRYPCPQRSWSRSPMRTQRGATNASRSSTSGGGRRSTARCGTWPNPYAPRSSSSISSNCLMKRLPSRWDGRLGRCALDCSGLESGCLPPSRDTPGRQGT